VTNRRQFLLSGLAASAAAAGALPVWRAAAKTAEVPATIGTVARSLNLERFIFDNRFAESVEAARVAAARGVVLAATAGDLTSLWYHDLDLRWKRAPMTLAGMTTRGNLFVLETLAADRGMRVVSRRDHGVALAIDGVSRAEPLFAWTIAPRSAVAAAV
jgi:hypothetical protein